MLKKNEKKDNKKNEIKKPEDNKELSMDEISEVNGGRGGNRPAEVSEGDGNRKTQFI